MSAAALGGFGRVSGGAVLVAALAVGLRAAGPQGQSAPTTAALRGAVFVTEGPTRLPVRRARVTLTAPAGEPLSTDTDVDGRYLFESVPSGPYRLTAAKAGFLPAAATLTDAGDTPVVVMGGPAEVRDVAMSRAAAIEGRILYEQGDPVVNFVVAAYAADAVGRTSHVPVQQVLTDDRGRYRLHTLPAGEYIVGVATLARGAPAGEPRFSQDAVPVYYPGSSLLGRADRVVVATATTTSGIDFTATGLPRELAPGAAAPGRATGTSAIEGRVLDEFGDPVAGVTIQLATVQFVAGMSRLMPGGGRFPMRPTDDTGAFRAFGLAPDDFYVMALPRPFAAAGPPGFATTLYPGTAIATAATPVRPPPGGDASGIVFSLVPTQTGRVTGVVVNESGTPRPGVGVLLRPLHGGDIRILTIASAFTREDGSFAFDDVADGSYVIQSFGPGNDLLTLGYTTFTAAAPVTGDIRVDVRRRASLRGRVVFDGPAPHPPPGDVTISVAAVGSLESVPYEDRVRALIWDGDAFERRGVSGVSVVRAAVRSEAWTMARVTIDGRDVTDTPLDFRNGDVDGVEVVFSNRVSSLSGTVSDGTSPASDYAIVVFSTDRSHWIHPTRRVLLARPDGQNAFRLTGIPAGSYLAVALARVHSTGWQDPTFLATLTSLATSVDITDGERKTISLSLKRP